VNSLQLHRQLTQELASIGLKARPKQRANLALLCQTLAFSPNCHLATLALGLPLPGRRENLIQHLRRTLKNQQLQAAECYQPLVRHLFAHWPDHEINLVMDRTDLENRWSLLTLGVAHQKRLVPLAWGLLPFGGTSADEQATLLKRVQPALPPTSQVRINFYGDCEFRAVPVQQLCQGFGWHWQVGLKSDLWFRSPAGEWQPLKALGLQPGQRRYLTGVDLTREHQFGPVNVIADWAPPQDTPRYWALDLPVDGHAWRRGRKRYWIEPTFRDWKSYGFDLERSQITDRSRLEVLLLGMAVTTVWLIHVGEQLQHSGQAYELVAKAQTDYSVFRLGRDYLQRCRTLDRTVPVGFTVTR
jgi:hypothetical protein